jgi:hypothetical protein
LVQCRVEARVGEDLAAQGHVVLAEAP